MSLLFSDVKARMWQKQRESTDPSYLVALVQADGGMEVVQWCGGQV